MHEDWVARLRCPLTGTPLDVDVTRGTPGEVLEAFLVARGGSHVRLVVSGLAVLPPDLHEHLRAAANVYWRMSYGDSRIVRFVLGRLGHAGHEVVPFDEVVRRYVDLLPPDRAGPGAVLAEEDASLGRLLAEADARGGTALDVGCGVGRGAFVLRGAFGAVLGVDRSVARVRRARNVATTRADFFLPVGQGGLQPDKEVALELDRLDRDGVDFAVAAASHLPLSDGAIDLVLLRRADGLGPLPDEARALREAARVLRPGGLLVLEAPLAPPASSGPWREVAATPLFLAWTHA